MPASIYLYTDRKTERIEYVFKLIFNDLLGFDVVHIISDLDDFCQKKNLIKISYGHWIDAQTAFLAEGTRLLWAQGLAAEKPIFEQGAYPYCFGHQDTRSLLSFDLPAMAFWLASRYEEYQDFEADAHGRFPAAASAASRYGFLQMPLINLWALALRQQLMAFYPDLTWPALPQYSYRPSYDIDYAWAYLHKAWWRQLGASARDWWAGQKQSFWERLAVLSGQKADPYYSFAYIDQLHQARPGLQPLFFWLLADHGPYDKNCSVTVPAFRRLIQFIATRHEIGIHPSYRSNDSAGLLAKELGRLEDITQQKVLRSRQHFLRLNFPDTYRGLLSLGIEQDYTMGYAEQLGFRASLASPFYWYDLEAEQETTLRLHPFMLMDVTLNVYLQLSPEAALQAAAPIISATQAVGGQLISLWHNNSFCESGNWRGWRAVYEALLQDSCSCNDV